MPRTSSLAITTYPRMENSNQAASPTSPQTPPLVSGIGSLSVSSTDKDTETDALSAQTRPSSSPKQPKSFFSVHRTGKSSKAQGSGYDQLHIPQSESTINLNEAYSSIMPYRQSPNSSTASLVVQGNSDQLETASMTTGSIVDSCETNAAGTAIKSNNVQQADTGRLLRKKSDNGVNLRHLIRTHSLRSDENIQSKLKPKSGARHLERGTLERAHQTGPRTAPLDHEPKFRDMMKSTNRNKSADRATQSSGEGSVRTTKPSSSREGGGLLSNLRNTSTTAAVGLGRASKGLIGKITRSGSSHERELPEENHIFRVINLPLVEQTRRTRIKPRMEDARDKTEFWMPALPYRCIDFLNWKGVEEEGLYRIPGSGREIKYWQTKFDTELDVNLLDQADAGNLYDINIVGSMLKAWLRELPDELFPKSIQSRIANECGSRSGPTPQLMKDELSKLPPFNYYLLFAITCHISLLHSNAERNKMNYHNLQVCFQPCIKIDTFCFHFLVCDWRNCWQGCWTEREYYEEERQFIAIRQRPSILPPIAGGASIAYSSSMLTDSRAVSPTASSNAATAENSLKSSEKDGVLSVSNAAEAVASNRTILPLGPALRTKHMRGHSTPPSLSPVVAISAMRL